MPLPRNSLVTGAACAEAERGYTGMDKPGGGRVGDWRMEVRPGNKARNRNVNYVKMNRRSGCSKLSCAGAPDDRNSKCRIQFSKLDHAIVTEIAISPLKKTLLPTDLSSAGSYRDASFQMRHDMDDEIRRMPFVSLSRSCFPIVRVHRFSSWIIALSVSHLTVSLV